MKDPNDPFFYRVDTQYIYSPFLVTMRTVLEDLASKGHYYVCTSAYRSPKDQTALYEQGRSKPGSIVTKAPAYQSWHNYGIACDFAYDLNGGQKPGKLNPSYDEHHLKRLAEAMVKAGLEAGYFWKSFQDSPHIQWPGPFTMSELSKIYRAGKLQDVWDHLDGLSGGDHA